MFPPLSWGLPVCVRGSVSASAIFPRVTRWIRIFTCNALNQNFANAQIAHATPKTWNPCIRGSRSIPVCIRGLHFMWSPYAYRDHQSPYAYGDGRDHRMHSGIAWHVIPVCIREYFSPNHTTSPVTIENPPDRDFRTGSEQAANKQPTSSQRLLCYLT